MKTEKRERLESLLTDVQEWYILNMLGTDNVTFIEGDGKLYEVVTYNYKELFRLCNYMQLSEFAATEQAACRYLRRFFNALEHRLMRGNLPQVDYYNVLKITVIRCAIEACR